MSQSLPNITAINSYSAPFNSDKYPKKHHAILSEQGFQAAYDDIRGWPHYKPTPLCSLDGLATQLSIAALFYKDESHRFTLNSFKALGGAYAVAQLLKSIIEQRTGQTATTADLLAHRYHEITADVVVNCATDGNHGRSVAWGAQLFGCRCMIYIHATVSEGRQAAIAAFDADVIRTDGNYDYSVRQAAADAERLGHHVISDTSYPGYTDIPRDVMQGYTVMVDEAIKQLPPVAASSAHTAPTHVFIQGGVGGMAAAICSLFWQRYDGQRPRFIIVEPTTADCIYRSLAAGQLVNVEGDLETIMAGLACGEVSLLAWQILQECVDGALTVDDQAAIDCMHLLAQPETAIVAGESAVAGLAGLIAVAANESLRQTFALDQHSRVLLFGSEGDTDPELYEQLIGRSAAEVRAHG